MGSSNQGGFSYQLYSSRNFGRPAETIRMLGRLGYAEAEAYGAVYPHAEEMKLALDQSGMRMTSGHFSLDQLEEDPGICLDYARRLGMSLVICPHLAASERPDTTERWHAFGARLQRLAEWFGGHGLAFCWHNHDFEFAPLPDDSRPIDHLFAGGPDVGWQIDVAWVVAAGEAPEHWIARHGRRIRSAHMKDMAPEGQNLDQDGWTAIGQGTIDWARLVPILRQAGCTHFVIEHDNPADDRSFAELSIAAARGY